MESTTAPPGAATHKTLADVELDRKIRDQITMIDRAIADRDRAVKTISKCEKCAVISAWRLGHFLIEKKRRLAHGSWIGWLDSCGISPSSASDYTRIARQIASAGNLGSSIRETLRTLPAPATAKPKTIAVKIVEPATAKPKTIAVKIVEPAPVWPTERDSAAMIEGLEQELYDARERLGIVEEAVDPKSRKAIDKLNNQAELIKTLKASVAEWQSKHADARRENGALKRKIKTLETELGGRRPRHAA